MMTEKDKRKTTGTHPRNDTSIRSIHFSADGRVIPEAEFWAKPAPQTYRVRLRDFFAHVAAEIEWERSTASQPNGNMAA